MNIAIMQPYFFPYIGYFQLIHHCDLFVVFDDVQYVKRRWINRNRILRSGTPAWLTLPVQHGAAQLPINQRYYCLQRRIVDRVLRSIETAYGKAPHFAAVFPLIERIMAFPDGNVAVFNTNLIAQVSLYLRIATPLVCSSAIGKGEGLSGQARILDICRRVGATRYTNPVGGMALYRADMFDAAGIGLDFLRPASKSGEEGGLPSAQGLSIIDSLMTHDADGLARRLRCYRVEAAENRSAGKNPDRAQ